MKLVPSADDIQFDQLSQPVTAQEIEAYRSLDRRRVPLAMWWIISGVGGFLLLIVGPWAMQTIGSVTVPLQVQLLIAVGIAAMVIYAARAWFETMRHVRFSRFAASCGLSYDPDGHTAMARDGMIFTVGRRRRYQNVLHRTVDNQRLFELGRYQYTVGEGRSSWTYHWRYICIDMRRNVPHMVLDSKDNTIGLLGKKVAVNSLPVSLSKKQRISLEGDFDTYFTLYAPQKYDVDARYIFTPDLMTALIDTSAAFDVEVLDDKLFFYTPENGQSDETMLRVMLRIIEVAGQKFYERTDHYADDRVARARQQDVVDQSGRRLKRSWRPTKHM